MPEAAGLLTIPHPSAPVALASKKTRRPRLKKALMYKLCMCVCLSIEREVGWCVYVCVEHLVVFRRATIRVFEEEQSSGTSILTIPTSYLF